LVLIVDDLPSVVRIGEFASESAETKLPQLGETPSELISTSGGAAGGFGLAGLLGFLAGFLEAALAQTESPEQAEAVELAAIKRKLKATIAINFLNICQSSHNIQGSANFSHIFKIVSF